MSMNHLAKRSLYILAVAAAGVSGMALFVSSHWASLLTGAVCGAGLGTTLCLIFPKPWRRDAARFAD